jgi:FkbM family methyltransferase
MDKFLLNFLSFFFSQNFLSRMLRKYSKQGHKQRFFYYKKKGLNLHKVLDVGAFEGNWTKMFKSFFPSSQILMVEANSEKEKILSSIGDYKIALLGAEDNKEVDYYKGQNSAQTGNSIFLENTKIEFKSEKRRTQTLTSLLGANESFDLIKMDVQGSELDIIKGGLNIVKNTKFLLIELQMTEYNKGAPKSEEVISFLKDINFEFIDIFDLLYSNEGCLVQVDGFFVNKKFKELINF